MLSILILSLIILGIAVTMSMVGKGGGNFYVLAMVLAGLSMQHAATTSQLIMIATSFTSMLIISVFMLISVREKPIAQKKKFGYWNRQFGGYSYTVNLWITLPITAIVGLFAGAIGISGGAFKIPLMVMLCGIPMEIAIGTSSAMVAVTALMGFLGHSVHGNYNLQYAIPLVIAAVLGGWIGSKYAIKSKPENLRKIFAFTNLLAAVIMIINILSSR